MASKLVGTRPVIRRGLYNTAAALKKILEDDSDVSDMSEGEVEENNEVHDDPSDTSPSSSEEDSDNEPLASLLGDKSNSWKKTDLFLPTVASFSVPDSDAHEARADWKPLDYTMQYLDTDIFKLVSHCTNVNSVVVSGRSLNTTPSEIQRFVGASILMSSLGYPHIKMFWQHSLRIPIIAKTISRDRYFRIRNSLKVVIDLALVNSWLLYKEDKLKQKTPAKDILKFLDFRIDVAQFYLAVADDETIDDSSAVDSDEGQPPAKRRVTSIPAKAQRTSCARHMPEMDDVKNAMRCRNSGCSGKTKVKCQSCKVYLCLRAERNCFEQFHRD